MKILKHNSIQNYTDKLQLTKILKEFQNKLSIKRSILIIIINHSNLSLLDEMTDREREKPVGKGEEVTKE